MPLFIEKPKAPNEKRVYLALLQGELAEEGTQVVIKISAPKQYAGTSVDAKFFQKVTVEAGSPRIILGDDLAQIYRIMDSIIERFAVK